MRAMSFRKFFNRAAAAPAATPAEPTEIAAPVADTEAGGDTAATAANATLVGPAALRRLFDDEVPESERLAQARGPLQPAARGALDVDGL